MAAITKSWVNILDGAVDPDSPIDAALMTGIRDDLVHLREWIGAGFFAGAVQNHNHDGVNSANVVLADNSVSTGKYINGSVTNAKLAGPATGFILRANIIQANAAQVFLQTTPTVIVSVDLGTVVTGDVIIFDAPFRFTTSNLGLVQSQVRKSAGTAAIHPSAYHSGNSINGVAAADLAVSGIIHVETGGTLTIVLEGSESGTPSGAVPIGNGFIRAIIIKGG